MRKAFILLLIPTALHAQELSKPGDAIEVESYRCEVISQRTFSCMNTGKICANARAWDKGLSDYYLGCAIEDWKAKHPGEKCLDPWYHQPKECYPVMYGGF